MDNSVDAVDGDILLKLKEFLLQQGQIEISDSQNFIYAFSDTFGELNVSNRGNTVIDLSTVYVPVPPATGNDILLDSDENIWMWYVVSDTDPDVGYGT